MLFEIRYLINFVWLLPFCVVTVLFLFGNIPDTWDKYSIFHTLLPFNYIRYAAAILCFCTTGALCVLAKTFIPGRVWNASRFILCSILAGFCAWSFLSIVEQQMLIEYIFTAFIFCFTFAISFNIPVMFFHDRNCLFSLDSSSRPWYVQSQNVATIAASAIGLISVDIHMYDFTEYHLNWRIVNYVPFLVLVSWLCNFLKNRVFNNLSDQMSIPLSAFISTVLATFARTSLNLFDLYELDGNLIHWNIILSYFLIVSIPSGVLAIAMCFPFERSKRTDRKKMAPI